MSKSAKGMLEASAKEEAERKERLRQALNFSFGSTSTTLDLTILQDRRLVIPIVIRMHACNRTGNPARPW